MTLLTETIGRERQALLFRAGEFNALQRKDRAPKLSLDRLDQVDSSRRNVPAEVLEYGPGLSLKSMRLCLEALL
jgi:hypothetical protein